MLLFDAHAHLDKTFFKDDLDSTIARAREAGLRLIVANGINPETNKEVLSIAAKHDIVKPALGLYPIEAIKMNDIALKEALAFIESHKDEIVSVGEVGLDYQETEERELQQLGFREVINLAKRIGRPLTVHSRKAEEDCIKILGEEKADKVIMHCFSGKKKLIQKIIDNQWFLTIPTNVVFSTHFQEVVRMAPMSRLLVETDSPFLSPVKGERNEPANIIKAVEKIAEIKEMETEEVANILWKNAQELFLSD